MSILHYFVSNRGWDVSFTLGSGEVLGVVGESGCSKSTLAKTLLRLIEPDAGQVLFEGQDVLKLDSILGGLSRSVMLQAAFYAFEIHGIFPFLNMSSAHRIEEQNTALFDYSDIRLM